MDFIDDVYYSVLGELVEPLPDVPDLFAPGMPCEDLYEQVLRAYERLRHRLGVREEDEDVEAIINALLAIQQEVAREMYRQGGKSLSTLQQE